MGISLKQRREMVKIERDVIRNLRDDQMRIRAAIKQSRLNIKMHQEVLVDERKFARIVKADQRAAAKAARILARNQRAHERIAKLEARIEAMRLKARA
jgi:hypothetical protein